MLCVGGDNAANKHLLSSHLVPLGILHNILFVLLEKTDSKTLCSLSKVFDYIVRFSFQQLGFFDSQRSPKASVLYGQKGQRKDMLYNQQC